MRKNRKNLLKSKAIVSHTDEIFQGKTFSFVTEHVTLPNGVQTQAALVRHPGSSAIVPVFEDMTVAMTHQYRHPVGRYLLEIPAGTLKPGESALECAQRELEEETGMIAGEFTHLSRIHILPSYSDEQIHIFLARGLSRSRQKLDQDEIIQVVKYPLARAMEMISGGEITCALTILSLYRALEYLKTEVFQAREGRKSDGC